MEVCVSSRVSGNPTYVAAYGMAVVEGVLPFPLALQLAELVIELGGGPVETGKAFPKRAAKSLSKAGFVELHSDFPAEYEALVHNGRSMDGSPTRTFSVRMTSEAGTPKTWATATGEAISLVNRHRP